MSFCQNSIDRSSFDFALGPFFSVDQSPFDDVFTHEDVQELFEQHSVSFGERENDVYTPAITLWAWLGQCLGVAGKNGKSGVAAVCQVIVLLTALHRPLCSPDTRNYCRARAKLPEPLLRELTQLLAIKLEERIPEHWKLHGRRVILVDGTTRDMPDTDENQQAFPQPSSQEEGLGFPKLRMVVLVSLATGALLDAAYGPYAGKETGESALFREMMDTLKPGDVVVADCIYCSYWIVAMCPQRGVDVVFSKHQARHTDSERAERLGEGDWRIAWNKPQRPTWMDQELYDQLPQTLTLRETHLEIQTPGCRAETIKLISTLLDPAEYSKEELGDFCDSRWNVELDLRAIKQSMKMEPLCCRSPFMIGKEIWMHFLSYNLIRKVMAQSALEAGSTPRKISFQGTVSQVSSSWYQMTTSDRKERLRLSRYYMAVNAKRKVGNRPDRFEPRAVKRRSKAIGYMNKPRAEARAELLKNRQQKSSQAAGIP